MRKMAKLGLSLMVVIVMVFTMTPFAFAEQELEGDNSAVSDDVMLTLSTGETFIDGGLTYEILEDDTVQVGSGTAIGNALADPTIVNVVIPANVTYQLQLYPVTQIATRAFQDTPIESVLLPEGLERIGTFAFAFCRVLEQVTVPASVTAIGSYAFYANNLLASVTFATNSKLETMGEATFAIRSTAGQLNNGDTTSSLVTITLPAQLQQVSSYLFYGQDKLEYCYFEGTTLYTIGAYSFAYCTSLKRIDLPAVTSKVVKLGRGSFIDNESLEIITFAGDMSPAVLQQIGGEFSGCSNIKQVAYYDKKWNFRNTGGSLTGSTGSTGLAGFPSSSGPEELKSYYTIRLFANKDDADNNVNPVGFVTVLEETMIQDVLNGNVEATSIFDQQNYTPDGWALEDTLVPEFGLSDSYYAYQVDSSDLAFGIITLNKATYNNSDQKYRYSTHDGQLIDLGLTVFDAAGVELKEGIDYTVEFKNSTGQVIAPNKLNAVGDYSVTIKATGSSYFNQVTKEFSIQKTDVALKRVFGSDRFNTMQAIVKEGFSSYSYATANQNSTTNVRCPFAIVANGVNFPDALAASSLAGALNAPILLTDPQELSEQVAQEIFRIGAQKIVVIGGDAAVSSNAYEQLKRIMGVTDVYRIAGEDRFDTANRIFTLGSNPILGAQWSKTCIISTGGNFADALSISPFAYSEKAPIFLCDSSTGLSTATLNIIKGGAFTDVIIVGGDAAVPSSVEAALSQYTVTRLMGSDRIETSLNIADYMINHDYLIMDNFALAVSSNFPDALAGSALSGKPGANQSSLAEAERRGSVLILFGQSDYCDVYQYIADKKFDVTNAYILGGEACVSAADEKRILAIWD